MLVLLRVIASNTIAITQRHLERTTQPLDVRTTQPFQDFHENLGNQHTKSIK